MDYFKFKPGVGAQLQADEDPLAELKRTYGEEWFHDASPAKAVIRAGGTLDQAAQLESDADVLRARKQRLEAEDPPMPTREQIAARLFEEGNYYGGSQAARVSALMNAAKLLGHVEERVNVKGNMNHTHKGGVMVVNASSPRGDIDAWEASAIDQQGQLPH